MTPPRNLGPVLAIAGLAVVVLACFAGFVIIGGPGDARANRQDMVTMQRVVAVANAAQCGYARTGAAPQTMADIKKEAEKDQGQLPPTCNYADPGMMREVDIVDYSNSGADRINLCATFLRPTKERANEYSFGWDSQFPELREPRRESGKHCFDVQLLKPQQDGIAPGVAPGLFNAPSAPPPVEPK